MNTAYHIQLFVTSLHLLPLTCRAFRLADSPSTGTLSAVNLHLLDKACTSQRPNSNSFTI
jgi:hypothetical protein